MMQHSRAPVFLRVLTHGAMLGAGFFLYEHFRPVRAEVAGQASSAEPVAQVVRDAPVMAAARLLVKSVIPKQSWAEEQRDRWRRSREELARMLREMKLPADPDAAMAAAVADWNGAWDAGDERRKPSVKLAALMVLWLQKDPEAFLSWASNSSENSHGPDHEPTTPAEAGQRTMTTPRRKYHVMTHGAALAGGALLAAMAAMAAHFLPASVSHDQPVDAVTLKHASAGTALSPTGEKTETRAASASAPAPRGEVLRAAWSLLRREPMKKEDRVQAQIHLLRQAAAADLEGTLRLLSYEHDDVVRGMVAAAYTRQPLETWKMLNSPEMGPGAAAMRSRWKFAMSMKDPELMKSVLAGTPAEEPGR